jgi:hypothetical protein
VWNQGEQLQSERRALCRWDKLGGSHNLANKPKEAGDFLKFRGENSDGRLRDAMRASRRNAMTGAVCAVARLRPF